MLYYKTWKLGICQTCFRKQTFIFKQTCILKCHGDSMVWIQTVTKSYSSWQLHFQKVLNVSLQTINRSRKGRQSREKLFVFRCSCLTVVCNKHIRQSQLHCKLWGRSQKSVLSFHSGFCGSKLRSSRLYKSFNPLSRHTGQTDIPMMH